VVVMLFTFLGDDLARIVNKRLVISALVALEELSKEVSASHS
jgi:hypothetical protein